MTREVEVNKDAGGVEPVVAKGGKVGVQVGDLKEIGLSTYHATMNGSATVLLFTSSFMLKNGRIAIHSATFCTYEFRQIRQKNVRTVEI